MRSLHRTIAVALAALVLLNSAPVATACGPYFTEPVFIFEDSPDLPFTEFTSGKIGIIRPALGRKTLVIAYRYLNGGAFTSDEQSALLEALRGKAPEDDGSEAVKAWISARKEFLKEEQQELPKIYTEREYGGYDFFPNCTKNAFEVAIQTLKDRAASYGDDENVKTWLATQDTVFQNCSGGSNIPSELGADSPKWLRKDRDYQIGAAYFYSLNFDEARARFQKIATDTDSPWQEIAPYLVGRTLIRQASLTSDQKRKSELYEQAENHFQTLIVSGGKFASAAGKLLALVKYQIHPEERTVELGRILARGYDENLRQDLIDYVWLIDRFESRVLKAEEERKKKLNPSEEKENPNESLPNKEWKKRYEQIERGELIEINIYPKGSDGNAKYLPRIGFDFKPDVAEADILAAFTESLDRPLTDEETKQIKEAHASALENRKWRLSPNRKWENEGLSKYEGCDYDCTRLTFDLVPDFLRSDDLSDWILTLQTKDPRAYRHALSQWRQTHSPAWLLTALIKAQKSSPRLPQLMRDAEKVGRDDPAFATVAYHLTRLQIAMGHADQARKLLDDIISWQSGVLPISAQNQFLEQRMQLADGLNEFLRSAQRKPIAFNEYGSLGTFRDLFERAQHFWDDRPWNTDDMGKTKEEHDRETEEHYRDLLPWDHRVVFDEKTVEIFNRHFSVQLLIESARNPNVPDYLQRSLFLAAWTRAIVLNNDKAALEIAPEVLKVAPEMNSLFAPYLKSKTIKGRRTEALYVLLKFPNLSPFVPSGLPVFFTSEELDYYFEDTWWCPLSETEYNNEGNEVPKVVPRPAFLTAKQLEAVQREHVALAAVGNGKSYLGKQVIEWAKTSPADARIPEALYIAVQANASYKNGCDGWEFDEKTKQRAETILRQRYPQSPWTAKLTPQEGTN
jgi:hypothetical protein